MPSPPSVTLPPPSLIVHHTAPGRPHRAGRLHPEPPCATACRLSSPPAPPGTSVVVPTLLLATLVLLAPALALAVVVLAAVRPVTLLPVFPLPVVAHGLPPPTVSVVADPFWVDAQRGGRKMFVNRAVPEPHLMGELSPLVTVAAAARMHPSTTT